MKNSLQDILYPPQPALEEGFLKVSDLHTIHYERSGNLDAPPVVLLHGGPGGGMQDDYRRYFNPKDWCIVQFSQRGCGQSTPFAELRENTTWDLIADIEKLREFFSIKNWCVFGGSWGSTLALKYAQTHPDRVNALFLRGIFLLRDREIEWFYQEGASRIYPDYWEKYLEPIPEDQRDDLLRAYHRQLTCDDAQIRLKAARAWSTWEGSTSTLLYDADRAAHYGEDQFAEAFARIECHYFMNKGFISGEDAILENMDKIKHIPGCIVQGRYDIVCPAESAWLLSKSWPKAEMIFAADSGHSINEPTIAGALVNFINNYRSRKL